ncbi:MAG: beta-glucosidase [Flavobacteriaceae bacterium]|nr:beta-glucosidase [Flavobacteriaceae bacterium]
MNKFTLILIIFLWQTGCHKNPSTKDPGVIHDSMDDAALLDLVQKQTFNYFWDGAEPISGMARERYHEDSVYQDHDQDIITIGGSGFGLMAMITAVERGFIERGKALERLDKILTFLENADRFHGAWPHWLNPDGSVYPFSSKDDGGDIVETAFLAQGLLAFRQYLDQDVSDERILIQRIQTLWEGIEWSWYTRGEDVLYWHWSPNFEWEMNFPIGGYNEALIVYVLAAASPTYPIDRDVYDLGWARSGRIQESVTYYDLDTELDHYEHDDAPVGPLFWAHYSYLGLNPKGLIDTNADYWKLNENHARIHYLYCIDNPEEHQGYGESMWGLTSSYSLQFYAAHRPGDDPGVISPTAALSSMPYTPDESIKMLRQLYSAHDTLIGQFGPYDAFSFEHNWFVPRYLAIDQGPIPVMIENHRSGLIWDLFMGNEDVKRGLRSLGFQSTYLED